MKYQRKHRRLQFDTLESRIALAGDVAASIVGGDLIIQGDDASNLIRIDTTRLEVGQVRITADPDGTVNGESAPVVLTGWTGDARMWLGDGSDRVVLDRVRAPGHVEILTGLHDDEVVVDRSKIHFSLLVQTGSGHDNLHIVDTHVRGRSWMRTFGGDDVIALTGSRFDNSIEVLGGNGNDTIQTDATFHGRVTIDGSPGIDTISSSSVRAGFDFRNGAQGWRGGFTDYPAGEEEFYELESGIRQLPSEVGSGTGFFLSGNNHSDDLFMFLKRRLSAADGIAANQAYQVRLRIVVASNAPSGAFGIGGSPGESVYLKAGAVGAEPRPVVRKGEVHLNVDKGNQSTSGRAASVVGTIGNGTEPGAPDPYVSLTRTHVHDFKATANSAGDLWLLVGTDSGYEGTTALFYQRIEVELIPITVPA